MHSRIFQVSTTEIAPSDYIQPDDVSDQLCDNGVADYTCRNLLKNEEAHLPLVVFSQIKAEAPVPSLDALASSAFRPMTSIPFPLPEVQNRRENGASGHTGLSPVAQRLRALHRRRRI